jgi:cellulose synthase/poly-beta-1,6-N-acetylglucosamine synthase-like glycosyltransferase
MTAGSARPAVDVVVPVAAPAERVRVLVARLRGLALREGDTLRVVDNRGVGVGEPEVVVAAEVRTSYHARNSGAALGKAEWLLFLDADVEAPPDLLDRLFEPAPGDRTGVLAGAVVDEPPGDDAPAAVRYAHVKQAMSQETTLGHGRWAFAQTANCAVRRTAFEAIGGFRDGVRSGGDADLCYRLAGAGWELEARPGAAVLHRNRQTVPRLLAQRARHGAGAAWLASEHPGALPRRSWPGLAWWATRRLGSGVAALARGDRDEALLCLLDGPAVWAFELGRLIPNRPLGRGRGGHRRRARG